MRSGRRMRSRTKLGISNENVNERYGLGHTPLLTPLLSVSRAITDFRINSI